MKTVIARICTPDSPERKALDKLRTTHAELENELEQLAAADLPVEEAFARLMRELREAANAGYPAFSGYARPGQPPPLPDVSVALLYSLFGEELEARLRAHLERITQPGLPREARAAAIRKLEGRLKELRRDEEVEVCRLEAAGLIVDRDRDADPAMLLAVWDQPL